MSKTNGYQRLQYDTVIAASQWKDCTRPILTYIDITLKARASRSEMEENRWWFAVHVSLFSQSMSYFKSGSVRGCGNGRSNVDRSVSLPRCADFDTWQRSSEEARCHINISEGQFTVLLELGRSRRNLTSSLLKKSLGKTMSHNSWF